MPGQWEVHDKDLRKAIKDLIGAGHDDEWTAPVALQVYYAARLLRRYCQGMLDLVHACVDRAGGRLPIGGDCELLITREVWRKIVTSKAWPLLIDEIGEERLIASCCTVSKGAVEEQVSAKADRGDKTRAVAAFLARLEEAGAIAVETKWQLELKHLAKAA